MAGGDAGGLGFRIGCGARRGGNGALALGGALMVARGGRLGAGLLGGVGPEVEGFDAGGLGAEGFKGATVKGFGGTALRGAEEELDVEMSDFGIVGGFPNVGGLARLPCPAGFSLGIPPANKPPSWGGPPPPIGPPIGSPTAAEDEAALPPFAVSTEGALLSLVSAFFNFLPA